MRERQLGLTCPCSGRSGPRHQAGTAHAEVRQLGSTGEAATRGFSSGLARIAIYREWLDLRLVVESLSSPSSSQIEDDDDYRDKNEEPANRAADYCANGSGSLLLLRGGQFRRWCDGFGRG